MPTTPLHPARRQAMAVAAMAVVFVVGVLVAPSARSPWVLAGLVAVAVAAMLFEVKLPWGGTVSMGHAVLIAYAGRLSLPDFVVIAGLALVVAIPAIMGRYGAWRGGTAMISAGVASAAALVGRALGNRLVAMVPVDHRWGVVAPVLLAGVAYLAVLMLAQLALPSLDGGAKGWRSSLSIYLSLLCAAVLFALASEKSPALGAVALVPLLVLRFSFRQYFEARRTYLQTTQALSMIPEVAGLTPLGHGERTAVYASALAGWLALPPEDVDLAATIARLHHIGQIAHPDLPDRPFGPEPQERQRIGEAGAGILSETGFLGDVAPHVAAVLGTDPTELSEIDAVVRVASTLDDLIGADARALPDAVVGLLARHERGRERTMALKLAELCDARPDVVRRACSVGIAAPGSGPARDAARSGS